MSGDRHITRDFRNLSGKGGRGLVPFDGPKAYDFPTPERVLWDAADGWYQRQGEYWAPIYAPHEPGAVEALTDALRGNVSCRPGGYGSGCSGPDIEVAEVIDELCEAGWRLTFDEARR